MEEDHEGLQLLREAQAGSRPAFDALMGRLEPCVRAFVRSRLPADRAGRLDPDEIVQDTFVRAHGSMGGFRGKDLESFLRWLLGIARIAVIKAVQPSGRREFAIEADVAKSGVSPSRALRREERFDRLEAAIGSLCEDYKKVLHLVRIEGLPMKEVAQRMGRSPEAVRKLFGRALLKLRERFGDTESLHLPDRQLKREGEPS